MAMKLVGSPADFSLWFSSLRIGTHLEKMKTILTSIFTLRVA